MLKTKSTISSKIKTGVAIAVISLLAISAYIFGLLSIQKSNNYYGYGYGYNVGYDSGSYGYGYNNNYGYGYGYQEVNKILLSSAKNTVVPGETININAIALDINGNMIKNPPLVFSTENGMVGIPVRVNADGSYEYKFKVSETISFGIARFFVRNWVYDLHTPVVEAVKEFKIQKKQNIIQRIFRR